MSDKCLNIIAFDVPDPPDYGGVMDVFYRIQALCETGVKVHLHTFQYGRNESKLLTELCASVIYYQRKRSPRLALSEKPFIVETRRDKRLLENLLSNPFPILFEGLHTTAFLAHPDLRKRQKIVRTHNIEHEYYRSLSVAESRVWKKYFFKQEARKLEKYEPILKNADLLLTISEKDNSYFSDKFGKTVLVNPFHPIEKMSVKAGHDHFAFYHGNFSVPENAEALRFLIKNVFTQIDVPLVIAGKDAERTLEKIPHPAIEINAFSNPDSTKMRDLSERAGVHVLPTFQSTGFKLKLLYTMFTARFIVTNSQMVLGTGLAPYCEIADTAESMAQAIEKACNSSPEKSKLENREKFLNSRYSNHENAMKIKSLLR